MVTLRYFHFWPQLKNTKVTYFMCTDVYNIIITKIISRQIFSLKVFYSERKYVVIPNLIKTFNAEILL